MFDLFFRISGLNGTILKKELMEYNVVTKGLFYNQGTSSVSFLVKNEMFCNSTTCFSLCYE